jgi:hypothetical protein
MNNNIFNSETHSDTGVDLTQVRECLALSHTQRLRRLEENTKNQLILNRLASAKSAQVTASPE